MLNKIDWTRLQGDRELAGECRILRAKLRHVVDRAFALVENLTSSLDDTDAIRTLRMFVLDGFDGRPPRLPTSWVLAAIEQLLDVEIPLSYARAA